MLNKLTTALTKPDAALPANLQHVVDRYDLTHYIL
jgi:hypothetical protein